MMHAPATMSVLGTLAIASLSFSPARDTGATKPQQPKEPSAMIDVSQQMRDGLQPFNAFLGEWEGTLGAPAAEGENPKEPLAITWTNAWSFDGRWLRMEFASREPMGGGPRGSHLEFLGMMTFNPAEGRIESIWMNPRIRARTDSYIDGREKFFETGSFDAAGKVLTLIAPKQYGKDAPVVEVRSTFTLVDEDHFTCVDAEKDAATGAWKPVTRFELRRRK